jgi:hypothetical protein
MVGRDHDASAANNNGAIFAGLLLWDNFPTLTLCRDFTNIIFQNVIVFKNSYNILVVINQNKMKIASQSHGYHSWLPASLAAATLAGSGSTQPHDEDTPQFQ